METTIRTEQPHVVSDSKSRGVMLVGFGLLCFVNVACFFPNVLIPTLDAVRYQTFNLSSTVAGLIAALCYAAVALRGRPPLLIVLSLVGHAALGVGILLAGCADVLREPSSVVAVGAVVGVGLSFSMLYWFCMLIVLSDSEVTRIQGLQALGGELLLIVVIMLMGALLHVLMVAAVVVSAVCALIFHRRAVGAGWSLPDPVGIGVLLRSTGGRGRLFDEVGSPFVGLSIVSLLYGAIASVVMGSEGSSFAATVVMEGGPIGALVFLVWSSVSRTKDFGFAMKVFFFVLVFAVGVLPFDAVSLGMSAGYQICSLLLFSYLIISLRDRGYRLTILFIMLGYVVMRAFFLVGLYLPLAFSVSSSESFISSTSLVLFLAYLLFAGILFFTSRERRHDREEAQRIIQERDHEKEEIARTRAAEDDQLYRAICEEIARTSGLTQRETEVMALLAKGRDLGYISEELVLARNTVKGYMKKVYAKMDVHTKQELIDKVEDVRRGRVETGYGDDTQRK